MIKLLRSFRSWEATVIDCDIGCFIGAGRQFCFVGIQFEIVLQGAIITILDIAVCDALDTSIHEKN